MSRKRRGKRDESSSEPEKTDSDVEMLDVQDPSVQTSSECIAWEWVVSLQGQTCCCQSGQTTQGTYWTCMETVSVVVREVGGQSCRIGFPITKATAREFGQSHLWYLRTTTEIQFNSVKSGNKSQTKWSTLQAKWSAVQAKSKLFEVKWDEVTYSQAKSIANLWLVSFANKKESQHFISSNSFNIIFVSQNQFSSHWINSIFTDEVHSYFHISLHLRRCGVCDVGSIDKS